MTELMRRPCRRASASVLPDAAADRGPAGARPRLADFLACLTAFWVGPVRAATGMSMILALCVLAAGILSGCAMQEDLLILNDRINAMNLRTNQARKEISDLQEQLEKTRKDVKIMDTAKSVQVLSKKQAEMGVQLEDIRMRLMRVQGSIEEREHRLQEEGVATETRLSGLEKRVDGLDDVVARHEAEGKGLSQKTQEISQKIDGLTAKISELEKRLTYLEGAAAPKAPENAVQQPQSPAPGAKELPKKSAQEEYDEAYELFKKNAFVPAREKFRVFLEDYPDAELAGNARFWLAETFYQQGRYEEAILEYEKVLSDQKGPKVPSALLKQGLAFYELGDAKTAKYLLDKLVLDYPKSEQAETARAMLKKWKAK